MPIVSQYALTTLDREDFGKLSYEAYGQILQIRKELGRCFDEKHYKQALSHCRSDLILEAPILVSHGSYKKFYFMDALLALGGILEFKASEFVLARHRSQLLHYLMLAELRHGLLINVRPDRVTQEFVNNALTRQDRLQFKIIRESWRLELPGAAQFEQLLSDLLHDWGTCLDLSLYEEALTHFCGSVGAVNTTTTVSLNGESLGPKTMRFVEGRTAFKLTCFDDENSITDFICHGQKLVNHTDLDALLWANIGRHHVTLHGFKPER
jgi:GxxExxY protein